MIYLDYSATTPVNEEVLDSFSKSAINYPGNPNSLHKLGIQANGLINEATNQIAALLNIEAKEIIYTSGSSEANNTAIKGIALKTVQKHINKLKYQGIIRRSGPITRGGRWEIIK